MIGLLQLPALLVGFLTVVITIGLAVLGLALSRRFIPPERLAATNVVDQGVFSVAGVLYAVLVAFVVVVVWEQFDQAQEDTASEAVAITELLRDSEGLPAANRPAIQQSLVAYARDVVNDEFPRMRHGESVSQQSDYLIRVRETYLRVQPVTQSEIAFYRESVTKLDDLGSARKNRISSSQSKIPADLWVLLLGGGAVMLVLLYMFATPDAVVHGALIALAAALLGFVLYLVFALEHPFVGQISVPPDPYVHVLETWAYVAPK